MEGHQKFLGGRGDLKAKYLEAKYEAKLEFLGGGEGRGYKTKNLPCGDYGYFLELHNSFLRSVSQKKLVRNVTQRKKSLHNPDLGKEFLVNIGG